MDDALCFLDLFTTLVHSSIVIGMNVY